MWPAPSCSPMCLRAPVPAPVPMRPEAEAGIAGSTYRSWLPAGPVPASGGPELDRGGPSLRHHALRAAGAAADAARRTLVHEHRPPPWPRRPPQLRLRARWRPLRRTTPTCIRAATRGAPSLPSPRDDPENAALTPLNKLHLREAPHGGLAVHLGGVQRRVRHAGPDQVAVDRVLRAAGVLAAPVLAGAGLIV